MQNRNRGNYQIAGSARLNAATVMLNANGERFVDEGADFRNYTYAKYGAVILRHLMRSYKRSPLYRGLNLGLFSYIKLMRTRTSPRGSNFTGNSLRSIHSDIGENNVRTLLRKEPCDLLSDARTSPRHEGDFPI